WKFSTSFPKVYTVCAIVLILSFTVFKIVTLAKKSSKRKIAKTVLQLFVIVGGFCSIVALVLNGYRFFALPIFVLIPVLHLALASFFRESK
ncbi:MAG: hypothetical protein IKI31_07205, partial [Treponema sp.]|nr:hypothetical protein [Treponema sp.]